MVVVLCQETLGCVEMTQAEQTVNLLFPDLFNFYFLMINLVHSETDINVLKFNLDKTRKTQGNRIARR